MHSDIYSMLRGEEIDPEIDERSGYELFAGTRASSLCGQRGVSPVASSRLFSEPPPVVYNPNVPIETFDFIITDECHRSIYNLWRQVLEYFDAYLIGALSHREALKVAREWAPLLGLTVAEFMKLRKNE